MLSLFDAYCIYIEKIKEPERNNAKIFLLRFFFGDKAAEKIWWAISKNPGNKRYRQVKIDNGSG